MNLILDFKETNINNIAEVGGKNASIGEMISQLSSLGVKVPHGFATTADAYKKFLCENNLEDKIYELLDDLDINDVNQLQKISKTIRQLVKDAKFSKNFEDQINAAYAKLNNDNRNRSFAVRSSATAEDLPTASFAGQHETFLNVSGIENILRAVKDVYASLFTERAIAYRVHNGFRHNQVMISAGVQQMIRSDLAASGVLFTMDTETGFDQVVFVTASYGLGEAIVQGAVNPDEFYVHKPTLEQDKQSIISRKLGSKMIKMVYAKSSSSIRTTNVNDLDSKKFCLNDNEILKLAKQALIIEKHYGRAMDIEWAKDGIDQEIYIIQARPETVKSTEKKQYIEQYYITEKTTPLTLGRSIGQKIGQGVARIIKSPKEMSFLKEGEILVADMTDPDWEPIMKRAAAIVTNRGGRTCHAAIIARELGIPAVVGCSNATKIIQNDKAITVSCCEGETGFVYPGRLKYKVNKTYVDKLPKLPVKLCLNLANPEQAFNYHFLPNDGIGLVRLEFIIGNIIGVHPKAILELNTLTEPMRNSVINKSVAYDSPVEFYIEKLAEGIATIAAAFYPKPIIVRFSDFKSNEYANLLGGEFFEPKEDNPMLGYRGASRYISGNFKECFALECEAIKRVYFKKGLSNTNVMFPFVRTVEEAEQLVSLAKHNGLERSKSGLRIYMMCEVPSNVVLAEEFLKHFDGYSIGSNDLTQLTLGLDRDSELTANLFDERNAAVKAMLHKIISTCKKLDKYVGICGQGPSDHTDFAKWLMAEGIESISLSPDTIIQTWLALGEENHNE